MATPRIKPINEQIVVITGASSGIGLATARLFAKKGAKVVLASRNEGDLGGVVGEIESAGGEALAVRVDVANLQDMERLRDEAIARFGGIDTWVNNAGTSLYGKLTETPLSEEKDLFETNYWGIRHGSRVAVRAMEGTGGVIINLGSEVSSRSIPLQGTYSATKHAVKAYTDALRMELEHDQVPIFISLIRPTAVDTPFPEHATSYLAEGEPSLPRFAYHPEVVARAIVHCATHPQRDVFVGAQSRFFSIIEAISPRAADFFMELMMFKEQSRGTKVPHTEEQEALGTPPVSEGEERGGHKGIVMRHSLYTFLAQRPWLAFTVVAGATALLMRRSRLKRLRGAFPTEAGVPSRPWNPDFDLAL